MNRIEPSWVTVVGGVPASRIEERCHGLGVRFDRARRVYWQRERLFPLAAPGPQRSGRGGFHPRGHELAMLVDDCLACALPRRPAGARSSLVPLRGLLGSWWRSAMADGGDPESGEEIFYDRVSRVGGAVRRGRVPPDLVPDDEEEPDEPNEPNRPVRGRPLGADELDAIAMSVSMEYALLRRGGRAPWRLAEIRRALEDWPDGGHEVDDEDRERAIGRTVARLARLIAE
ncbi:MAG: hypothetical protein AB7V42_11250 [Thermoleophilia bacterium]